MVVKEMDPDNPAVEGLFLMTQIKGNLGESLKNKGRLEEYFIRSLNDTDNNGNYLPNDNPIEVDPARMDNAKKRLPLDAILQRKTAAMIQMENKLMTPTTINIKDVPMRQAINDLRQQYALNFDFDDASLLSQGISLDRPVTLQLDGVMLKTALELLLKKLGLSFTVKESHIEITTKENAKGQLFAAVSGHGPDRAGRALDPGSAGNAAAARPAKLERLVGPGQHRDEVTNAPPTPTGGAGYGTMMPGTPTGEPSGNSYGPPSNPKDMTELADQYGHSKIRMKKMATREDALIKLITNTIDPNSWADAGGQGTIDYFPLGVALVINQTLGHPGTGADLLQALRRLQDQEVAVEVRLITVDEDYYERIGLDFNMNIPTNARNNKFVPAILANPFTPPGQFNSIQQGANGLLAGITAGRHADAGPEHPDQPNSFTPAVPPFGGYQVPGVGGLASGLAFLSDIQVFHVPGSRGRRRAQQHQPVAALTLQNGQHGHHLDQRQPGEPCHRRDSWRSWPTAALPGAAGAADPQRRRPDSCQAVISADRRFVRLIAAAER